MENDSILTIVNELLSDYSLKPSQFAVKIGYDTSTFAKALNKDVVDDFRKLKDKLK